MPEQAVSAATTGIKINFFILPTPVIVS